MLGAKAEGVAVGNGAGGDGDRAATGEERQEGRANAKGDRAFADGQKPDLRDQRPDLEQ